MGARLFPAGPPHGMRGVFKENLGAAIKNGGVKLGRQEQQTLHAWPGWSRIPFTTRLRGQVLSEDFFDFHKEITCHSLKCMHLLPIRPSTSGPEAHPHPPVRPQQLTRALAHHWDSVKISAASDGLPSVADNLDHNPEAFLNVSFCFHFKV